MMYKVVKYFTDLQDSNHPYNVGDIFPRAGFEVLPSRLKELSSDRNRQRTPLIELVEEVGEAEDKPKSKRKSNKSED